MKNKIKRVLLSVAWSLGVGCLGWYMHAQWEESEAVEKSLTHLEISTQTASLYSEFLYCDGSYKRERLLDYMNLAVEVWVYYTLNLWDSSELVRKCGEDAIDIFALFFSDDERAQRFFEVYRVPVELQEKAELLRKKGIKYIEDQEKKSLELLRDSDSVRRIFFTRIIPYSPPHLFSYKSSFIDANNRRLEDRCDDESELNEFALESELWSQYRMKGRSKKDADGKYILYFLLDKNCLLSCPMNERGALFAPIKVESFSQLIIHSDGVWEVKNSLNNNEKEDMRQRAD